MLKAIVFDFDYTLGDSTQGIALSINYALSRLGYEQRDIADIKRTVGLSLKETYCALTASDNEEEIQQFIRLFKEKADQVMVDHTQVYEGVKEVLQKIKACGYKTAIVTSKYHYRIRQILDKFDANELIDVIVGAEDVKVEKPDPEGLLWTVKHLHVEKEEVLYVGDSLVDAKTAENADVAFAAVLTGTTTKEEFQKHDHVYIGQGIKEICESYLLLH